MIGRELAELIIPAAGARTPSWVERYARTGHASVEGHPLEARGHARGRQVFPVELIVTRADLPGSPLFCGYLRDVTEARERERDLRRLAAEQAALRRVATAVATRLDPRHAFAVVTEEVGRLLSAQSSNMVRFDDELHATVVGAWNEGDVQNVPVGDTVRMDGDTASTRVFRTGAPARVDSYDEIPGELSARLRVIGLYVAVAAPIFLSGGCGAR